MPRVKRKGPVLRRRELLPEERAVLLGEVVMGRPRVEGLSPLLCLLLEPKGTTGGPDPQIAEAWEFAGEDLVAEWIRTRPGTRPRGWWIFAAPRCEGDHGKPYQGWYSAGSYRVTRERLGGTGTPKWEALNYAPSYEAGVPTSWITRSDVSCYEHGLRNRLRPNEPVEAFDPDDPPLFESEAAYLRRLDLLLPGEVERLGEADFEPVPALRPCTVSTYPPTRQGESQ